MNIYHHILKHILDCVVKAQENGDILTPDALLNAIVVEPPKNEQHGDMATNVAMVLAKSARKSPRELAQTLMPLISDHSMIKSVEIAGPGFINIRLEQECWLDVVQSILKTPQTYCQSLMGQGQKVNVEYVSVNPTGPLHAGHARGAVFGDILCAILANAGYEVTKEYYVNDAGKQIEMLALSLLHRYKECCTGVLEPMPDGLYPGEYLTSAAKKLQADKGDNVEFDMAFLQNYAADAMMDLIRQDLAALGIKQDVFTSEKAIVESGGIQEALDRLEEKKLLYRGVIAPPKGKKPDDWESREQLLFKSTEFEDDVDRPLQKSDGSWTYFTPDVAYHYDKIKRDFDILINVFGADHAGYAPRIKAAVLALSDRKCEFDIQLCQMVRLLEDGKLLKMSKRSGHFVTLRELIDDVGAEVVRFFMITRRNDAQLDFDLAKVREESRDNMIFYIQYAHARCCSVQRLYAQTFPNAGYVNTLESLNVLSNEYDLCVIKLLAQWPRVCEMAAQHREPHRVAFYLYDLASAFHSLWTRGKEHHYLRFIDPEDKEKTQDRMALVTAFRSVIANGVQLLGIEPKEELGQQS